VRNSAAGHVTVSDVFVTIAGCTFDPWPGLHQAVEEHSSLILTQTGATVQCGTTGRGNFDTSDTVPPGANPCVNDGILPIVHVTVNGISEVFEDTRQTLNNGGVDTGFGGCPPVRAENLPWHQISEGGGHVPAVVCQVHNGKTGATVDNLQAAVTAADSGDTLTVSGYCIGTTTIDKNLTIIGHTVDATLDGDQKGSVLTIRGSVTLTRLNIINGNAAQPPPGGENRDVSGGGIENHGTVALNLSSVSGNTAGLGGGIFNGRFSSVSLRDSTVRENTANRGGGIDLGGRESVVSLTNSTVTENTALRGGGIFVTGPGLGDEGRLTVTNSDITDNTTTDRRFSGGGIEQIGSGSVGIFDSRIIGNAAAGSGGGIASTENSEEGGVRVTRTTITGNTAGYNGGGIYSVDGNVGLHDSTVTGNTANTSGGNGLGGCIYIHRGTVNPTAPELCGIVRHNTPNDVFRVGTGVVCPAPAP
jgi:predicted outer membrane repeat protein